MGDIFKTVIALLIFAGGVLAFEKVESRFLYKNWGVVAIKITVALLLIFAYGFLLQWLWNIVG